MFKEIGQNIKLRAICDHYGISDDDARAISAVDIDTKGGTKGLHIYDDVRMHHVVSSFKKVLGNNKTIKARERLIADPNYREKMFQIYNEKIVPALEKLSNFNAIKIGVEISSIGRLKELDK